MLAVFASHPAAPLLLLVLLLLSAAGPALGRAPTWPTVPQTGIGVDVAAHQLRHGCAAFDGVDTFLAYGSGGLTRRVTRINVTAAQVIDQPDALITLSSGTYPQPHGCSAINVDGTIWIAGGTTSSDLDPDPRDFSTSVIDVDPRTLTAISRGSLPDGRCGAKLSRDRSGALFILGGATNFDYAARYALTSFFRHTDHGGDSPAMPYFPAVVSPADDTFLVLGGWTPDGNSLLGTSLSSGFRLDWPGTNPTITMLPRMPKSVGSGHAGRIPYQPGFFLAMGADDTSYNPYVFDVTPAGDSVQAKFDLSSDVPEVILRYAADLCDDFDWGPIHMLMCFSGAYDDGSEVSQLVAVAVDWNAAGPPPTTGVPTTGVPTTGVPTTGVPTTGVPTTGVPTTGAPTTGVSNSGSLTQVSSTATLGLTVTTGDGGDDDDDDDAGAAGDEGGGDDGFLDDVPVPVLIGAVAAVVILCCLVLLACIVVRRRRSRSGDDVESTSSSSSSSDEGNYEDAVALTETPPPALGAAGADSRRDSKKLESIYGTSAQLALDDQIEGVEFGPELGKGQFGTVFRGTYDGDDVAVKQVRGGADGGAEVEMRKELSVMLKLRSPRIVKLYGVCAVPESLGGGVGLVMELCTLGGLDEHLRKHGAGLSIPALLQLSTHIAEGLAYIASKNLVHRDLACRNVLVAGDGSAKLADFGLARTVEDPDAVYLATSAIPVRWSAPEVLESGEVTMKSDIYSLGATLVELWNFGQLPYAHLETNAKVVRAVVGGERPPRPEACPEPTWELNLAMMAGPAKDRPSASQCVSALRLELNQELSAAAGSGAATPDADQLLYSFGSNMGSVA